MMKVEIMIKLTGYDDNDEMLFIEDFDETLILEKEIDEIYHSSPTDIVMKIVGTINDTDELEELIEHVSYIKGAHPNTATKKMEIDVKVDGKPLSDYE